MPDFFLPLQPAKSHHLCVHKCLSLAVIEFLPFSFSQQMAEPGRTIRVSGLPTDIEHKRLKDKLFIHFLRERNGGGEIDSIVIDRVGSALITFEDSGGQWVHVGLKEGAYS